MRQLSTSEYLEAGATQAEAFGNRQILNYVGVKDNISAEEADKWTKAQFDAVSWLYANNGTAYTVGNNYEGIALWMGPGQDFSYWSIIRSGFLGFQFMMGSKSRTFYNNTFLKFLPNARKEILGPDANNYWYLNCLATKVSARGQGYARQLLDPILRIADENGQKCYLEASTERNRNMYYRFGFRVVKELWVPDSDPPMRFFAMLRDPVEKK